MPTSVTRVRCLNDRGCPARVDDAKSPVRIVTVDRPTTGPRTLVELPVPGYAACEVLPGSGRKGDDGWTSQRIVLTARREAVRVRCRQQESLCEVVGVSCGEVLRSRQDARLREVRGLIRRR